MGSRYKQIMGGTSNVQQIHGHCRHGHRMIGLENSGNAPKMHIGDNFIFYELVHYDGPG